MKIVSTLIKPGMNHRTGRRRKVEGLVIHVTEGSASSVLDWFRNPNARGPGKPAGVSSNYMIDVNGLTYQFVSEDDEAWAQGEVVEPSAQIVLDRPGVSPNSYLLSIEHEGDGLHELTAPQRASSIALIRDIAARHDFAIDRYHVIGHHEVKKTKPCPGKINVDKLVADAVGTLATTVAQAPDPPIVWSDYLNDWLVVTRVVSDREWYFVPMKLTRTLVGAGASQAQTLLSSMPTRRS